jgi:hypothetical protein
MTAAIPDVSRQAAVDAALLVLERMGLTPADLAAVPQPRALVPTFAAAPFSRLRGVRLHADHPVPVRHLQAITARRYVLH